jgi:fucose permease
MANLASVFTSALILFLILSLARDVVEVLIEDFINKFRLRIEA